MLSESCHPSHAILVMLSESCSPSHALETYNPSHAIRVMQSEVCQPSYAVRVMLSESCSPSHAVLRSGALLSPLCSAARGPGPARPDAHARVRGLRTAWVQARARDPAQRARAIASESQPRSRVVSRPRVSESRHVHPGPSRDVRPRHSLARPSHCVRVMHVRGFTPPLCRPGRLRVCVCVLCVCCVCA
jgi:hypothetical protein